MSPRAQKRLLDSLSIELASEAELESLAELGSAEQRRDARAALLARARHWAHVAAAELMAGASIINLLGSGLHRSRVGCGRPLADTLGAFLEGQQTYG